MVGYTEEDIMAWSFVERRCVVVEQWNIPNRSFFLLVDERLSCQI